jgi:hypothetical protein
LEKADGVGSDISDTLIDINNDSALVRNRRPRRLCTMFSIGTPIFIIIFITIMYISVRGFAKAKTTLLHQ